MFRRRSQGDFAAELESHLQLEIDRLVADGMDPEEAYRTARRTVGNLQSAQERFYESGRLLWLDHFLQDTRHILRRLSKAPVFTLTVFFTVALGVGATTSIFTLLHAVLMKSLPVSNPDALYRLGRETHCCVWGGYSQDKEFSIVSNDLYLYLRDHTKGFAELAAFQAGETWLGVKRRGSREPARGFGGEFVSGNYFKMFGVQAYAGRTFGPDDDRPDAQPVVVMSYRVWENNYALDPGVIGAIFNIDEQPFTVVGVAPPGFYGDALREVPPDFFLPPANEPLVQGDSSLLRRPDSHWLDVIGRIQPGVKPEALEAQMRVELHQWIRSHSGATDAGRISKQTLYLSPGGAGITDMRERYQHWLEILMTVASFVLLIVCANVASLLLVRAIKQRRQTSLSMALGARPGRLVRQAFTESLLLSLFGGAGGVAIAVGGTRLILHFAFRTIPGLGGVPIAPSPSVPVLAFAFAVSLVTGVLFGTAPAWMTTRVDPIDALRGASRSAGRRDSLSRRAPVVLQAALTLVLLSASELLTATLHSLEHQNFGFEQERRVVLNIDPLLAGYKAPQLTPLYRRLRESLASVPGVESVAVCLYSPQSGDNWNDAVSVDGHPAGRSNESSAAGWNRVTTGFFETIGNPIVGGRAITDQDTSSSPRVAVINQAFARRFFKQENPIGRYFGRVGYGSREFQIVGVAKDARILTNDIDRPIAPFFFVSESQFSVFPKHEDTVSDFRSHFLHDIVVQLKPGAVLSETVVRHAVAAADENLPVNMMMTMREQVAGTFTQQRLIARLTSLFGILSLVLASIGLYGVTSYNAESRTAEIGIRMALGANRGDVLGLVLRDAFVLIGLGLAAGIPLAAGAGRFLGSQLYGTNPLNPLIIGGAVLCLTISAFIAALIPALRASSVSPLQALRSE